MHRQFFRKLSQHREFVKNFCTDLNKLFHFACRKWFLYNIPHCCYSVSTPIKIRLKNKYSYTCTKKHL